MSIELEADQDLNALIDTPVEPDLSAEDVARQALADQIAKMPPEPDAKPEAVKVEAKPDAARDAAGKFAPVVDAPVAADAPAPVDASPAPPSSWSPQAKALWAKEALTPVELATWKAEISKRESDVSEGFKQYGEYKPLKPYMDMAKQGGTTLDRALENYTGIEKLLRTDVFAGVQQVLKNVNVDMVSFANAVLARQSGQPQGQPQQAQQPQYNQDEVVQRAIKAIDERNQNQQAVDQVRAFENNPKNIYYNNVKATMHDLIQIGRATSLEQAYNQACAIDPAIAPLLNNAALPPAAPINAAPQARAMAKATLGAPSNGLKPKVAVFDDDDPIVVARAALNAQLGRI